MSDIDNLITPDGEIPKISKMFTIDGDRVEDYNEDGLETSERGFLYTTGDGRKLQCRIRSRFGDGEVRSRLPYRAMVEALKHYDEEDCYVCFQIYHSFWCDGLSITTKRWLVVIATIEPVTPDLSV